MFQDTTITGNTVYDLKVGDNAFNVDNPEKARVRLRVAVNKRDRDGEEVEPDFFDITVFGYRAAHLYNSAKKKGTRITAQCAVGTYPKEVFDEDGEAYDLTMIGLTAREVAINLEFNSVTVEERKKSRRGKNDDFDEEEDEQEEKPKRTSRSTRSSRSKAEEPEDGDYDDEEGEEEKPKRASRAGRTSRSGSSARRF